LFFVFPAPAPAVAAAITAQRKLDHYDWPAGVRLRVRTGIHCGPVTISGGEYVALTVHEVSRVCAAAHGGQVLCSSSVADALPQGPAEGKLRELGVYQLRGFPDARPLFQVCGDGLDDDFPPPRDSVRDGGVRVSIWRRASPPASRTGAAGAPTALDLSIDAADDVEVEIRRASNGPA